MSAADRREERISLARERAKVMSSGFTGSCLKVPDGLRFFVPEAGTITIDLIPYLAGKGNPVAKNPGTMYYERTYFRYRGIGPEEKSYICASRTFGHRDYIQDYVKERSKSPDYDKKEGDALKPQAMQLFFVFDHENPDKGLQLWDFASSKFGKVLDDRLMMANESKGWDFFYWPDETGFTLEIALKKEKFAGNEYLQATAIDFTPRSQKTVAKVQELFEMVKAKKWCLDEFLLETPYEELEKIFHGIPLDKDGEPVGQKTTPPEETRQETVKVETARNVEKQPEKEATPAAAPAAGTASEEKLKKIYTLGYNGFKGGEKRVDNPFDAGSDRYQAWTEGWLAAYEESHTAAKSAETTKVEPPKEKTAAELGLGRGSPVKYNGEKYEIVRINDDGTVNLMNADSDVVKEIWPSALRKIDNGSDAPKEAAKPAAETSQTGAPAEKDVTKQKWDDWD